MLFKAVYVAVTCAEQPTSAFLLLLLLLLLAAVADNIVRPYKALLGSVAVAVAVAVVILFRYLSNGGGSRKL